jgi:hypothetical protein
VRRAGLDQAAVPVLRLARTSDGGRMVRARKSDFGAEKQQRFFEHLAETANVSAAARAAGVALSTVHRWRHRDADFRRGWEQALTQGYADLEMHLLRQAIYGTTSETVTETTEDGRKIQRTVADNSGLATKLLDAHKAAVAAAGVSAGDAEAVPDTLTDEIIARMRADVLARLEQCDAVA